MFPYEVDETLRLRPLEAGDAQVIFELIERNRAHLDPWLRWSGRVKSVADAQALIQRFQQKLADGDGFHAGMWVNDKLAGGLVCHFINRESNKSEIGYWLGADFVGQGLVTRASRAVISYLFEDEKMHRIEIQCATDNVRSRGVAERLGFQQEGIKRESDWLTTRYADHYMYALLENDWPR